MIENFHLLRPAVLLLIIPAALILLGLWRQRSSNSAWEKIIDPRLLPHLLQHSNETQSRWPLFALACAMIIAITSVAGPAWQRLPQAVSQSEDALVIVFDLSLSMRANDVQPSRVERAQLKIRDILAERNEGLTAFVVYAGDAHTVSPFTDDINTITAMLPALQPEIMPKLGNRTDAAISLATQLITDAGLQRATILLICDELQEKQIADVSTFLDNSISLSIMSVGTETGGPIPLPQGGFLRDTAGEIIVPGVKQDSLRKAASQLGARYHPMSQDNTDFQYLLPTQYDSHENNRLISDSSDTPDQREFDVWRDEGPFLALLLLPFGLLAFRRGWFLALAFIAVLPEPAQAFEWQDLWARKDQQASKALQAGDAEKAAELFQDTNWKASAQYKTGDYESAAQLFDENNAYNQANALARAGKLKESISAYDKALSQQANNEDAKFNKKIVEVLLKQQEKEKEEQKKQDQKDQQENEDSDQDQDQDQQDEGQQGDPQDSDDEQKQQDEQDGSEQKSDEQKEQEQEAKEQQEKEAQKEKEEQAKQQDQDEQQKSEEEQQAEQQEMTRAEQEKEQELKQWLRKVPDDPGGLLRNKFKHQYEQNRRKQEYYDDSGQIW